MNKKWQVFDKTTSKTVASFDFDYEASHFATNLNWDTGHWGRGREKYDYRERVA